jgi:hypothetical protein
MRTKSRLHQFDLNQITPNPKDSLCLDIVRFATIAIMLMLSRSSEAIDSGQHRHAQKHPYK